MGRAHLPTWQRAIMTSPHASVVTIRWLVVSSSAYEKETKMSGTPTVQEGWSFSRTPMIYSPVNTCPPGSVPYWRVSMLAGSVV